MTNLAKNTTLKLLNGLALLAASILTFVFCYFYSGHKTTFYGDSLGYYRYLPSAFIYGNLISYEVLPGDKGLPQRVIDDTRPEWTNDTPATLKVNRFTYGVALTELPFFLVAHAWERATGQPANGYSDTYDNAVKASSLVYTLAGLLLVYGGLRRRYGGSIALYTVLLMYLATNMFWFAIMQGGMSNSSLLFLYALLIRCTMALYDRSRAGAFFVCGVIAGFITLVRPTDIFSVLIPLFYGVYDRQSFRDRLAFIKERRGSMALAIIGFILPVLPQLILWKLQTGHWVVYSYGDQGFDWLHPKVIEGVFYFENGWLPYAPVMVFALLGLLLRKRYRDWTWCIWLFLPAYVYVIYCWHCYRYINGLGSRPMVSIAPLLAFPLAAFLQWLSERKKWLLAAFAALCIFLTAANMSISYQQMRSILWSEESNMVFNLQMLFRTDLRYEDLVVNNVPEFQPDTACVKRLAVLGEFHFDDSNSVHTQTDPITGHKYCYHMFNEEFPEAQIRVLYDKKKFGRHKWLKCSARFMYEQAPDYFQHMLVLSIPGKHWCGCKVENKSFEWKQEDFPGRRRTLFDHKEHVWGTVYYFTRLPGNMKDGDRIELFVWDQNRSGIWFDDLKLEIYE